ncbi:MAG: SDR family NAD(P)-dependent oxidoreductase [Deltaproteobacteria bacterium]|nr:SDR family NAD(P)-dependent oxidoreductase [Deltaproteobacteria bacterium]
MTQSGQLALVTGASSGIGLATAVKLGKQGFRVIAASRRMGRLNELAARVENIIPKKVDLSENTEIEVFCKYLSGLSRPVSILINSAGYGLRGVIEDVPLDAARRLFQVNVFSVIQLIQTCLPRMREMRKGTIVNISALDGKMAFPNNGAYAATKHALEAITDALRMEVRPFGIRVIGIRPGFVSTEFNHVADAMTGDLFKRTDPDYRSVYQAAWDGIGNMLVNKKISHPGLIADVILKAVLSETPRSVYSAGLLSKEFLGQRAGMDDDAFDDYMTGMTGLKGLKV